MKSLRTFTLTCGVAVAAVVSGPALSAPLQVAVEQSPSGLDPHIVTAFSSFQIIDGTIYEGLTALDNDLNIVPGLASEWQISDDKTTYTFTLREGVTFHGGDAMTSADVVASLNRVLAENTGSPLASRLAAVDSIETPDDSTVVLNLSAPSAPLLSSLTSIAIVPAKYEDDTDSLQRAPDGTGPFKFVSWQPDVAITLEANADYWDEERPALEGVVFNIVPEAATRQVGLNSGQYQMLPNIDGVMAQQFQGAGGVQLEETLELAYSLIGINVSRPPFDNAKVREAINYAINRDDIVAAALFGAGVPGGPLSPALTNYALPLEEFGCFTPSADKARALLEEAGIETPIEATLLVLPRDSTKGIAQVVQQQLAAIGIDLELDIPEIGQFVQNWRNSEFDMFVSLNSGTIEPDDYFYRTFRTGGSTNVFKYSNETLDALLDAGREETDTAKRQEIYADAQRELACQGPAAFLTYGQLYTAMRDNVDGYSISPTRSMRSLGGTSVTE
ncbi:MAG: ABC transporter substrate-binding protein [Roseitalea sp.]|jgi:peptide/nickel transport system substrate-binding protein|uniref:ABC transporter substrate-binding protein n=1 Tax=Oceaniradius stylonematis TaxID=2184161 RepID=A0A3A8A9Y6_9HYPH|nr:ABC transporter substrate-binding protein [Oceaniradius stylonematis]MBO6554804.1 ABC transporter substrate-binding protein [Roseitalea sp.]MBO6951421.1 ABC transporter substrate-binding protein [Rhizobiaceae bacterium]RNC93594.1 MAG: ABC transporter substrate-binding protein [Oricola sp.]MBO6594162.1 ABC transporter substrate-binding protein [Roseitalea sp.]MBO6601556.1 ABC transporter substrate-binding protein [Roseitalea sp.]